MDRWDKARQQAAAQGIDALLITPGADLRYLTGYHALPLERLTCLVLPVDGEPTLVVPGLERAAAEAAGVTLPIAPWNETEDPFELVARLLGTARRIGVDDHMWAARVFALRDALPEAEIVLGGAVVQALRIRKDPDEVAALREAGAAIDRVHAQVGQWLKPGRTEAEVGADIERAILAEHATCDFVIVGSGPNGASPHHEVSDRVIRAGDPVVVDIGGTMPSGYCSDCTRTYVAGGVRPPQEFLDLYQVLLQAQTAQREHARPGVTAESVDAVGRDIINQAGYGDLFIHRTGHGIGQETHEEPYIVAGNTVVLEDGMAFSIEPGIYREGHFGARIEDIVICTADGLEVLNNAPRDLIVLD